MKGLFSIRICLLALLLLFVHKSEIYAQELNTIKDSKSISMHPFDDSMRHWYNIYYKGNIIFPLADRPRYNESEITKIADNILLFQRDNGGWPKNYDMQTILTPEQADSVKNTKQILHTTFDNSTTYTHIDYLAQAYTITRIEKYKDACLKGIQFIFDAQYTNGGWPQYYPIEKGKYSSHITFNDGAYMGIMFLLKKIIDHDPSFSFLDNTTRAKAKLSFDKGLRCILDMQIIDNGKLTAWCQQHDEVTLKPVWARAFEPPGICNGESVSVVLLLMQINNPSAEIIKAVQSAVQWFSDSRIMNTRVDIVRVEPVKSKWRTSSIDKVVVIDSLAPPIWTRYYELGTHRPLFCNRNSKYLYSLSEVSRERRSGYAWYTYVPQEVLDKYPVWQQKWAPDENVLEN